MDRSEVVDGWADEEDLWMWGTRGGDSGNCVGVAEGTGRSSDEAMDAWDGWMGSDLCVCFCSVLRVNFLL